MFTVSGNDTTTQQCTKVYCMAKHFTGPQFSIGFPQVFTEIICMDRERLVTFCLTFCTDRSQNKSVDWLCKAGGVLLRMCRNDK